MPRSTFQTVADWSRKSRHASNHFQIDNEMRFGREERYVQEHCFIWWIDHVSRLVRSLVRESLMKMKY